LGKAALELRIANVEKSKGGTRTGTALEFGLKRFRSDARKDSSVAKYMFVLTDGESVADDQGEFQDQIDDDFTMAMSRPTHVLPQWVPLNQSDFWLAG
jgi:hypothetical protein